MDQYYISQLESKNDRAMRSIRRLQAKMETVAPKIAQQEFLHEIKDNKIAKNNSKLDENGDFRTIKDAFNAVFPEMTNDPLMKFSSYDKKTAYESFELEFGALPED
ncbi:Hypothetical_protein [Hexamita inflata]|uniref:Hypothetical_protein n=1 Tax=Hexamita inflata TaxID=28002 RepID=A0AA86QAV9_9EUKA|nr:Hypothetical protein HINF_LOCUS41246 [Hexamita inflata]